MVFPLRGGGVVAIGDRRRRDAVLSNQQIRHVAHADRNGVYEFCVVWNIFGFLLLLSMLRK